MKDISWKILSHKFICEHCPYVNEQIQAHAKLERCALPVAQAVFTEFIVRKRYDDEIQCWWNSLGIEEKITLFKEQQSINELKLALIQDDIKHVNNFIQAYRHLTTLS